MLKKEFMWNIINLIVCKNMNLITKINVNSTTRTLFKTKPLIISMKNKDPIFNKDPITKDCITQSVSNYVL